MMYKIIIVVYYIILKLKTAEFGIYMYRRARNISLIIKVEWPRVEVSGKCHACGWRLKAGVAHSAILRGKHHNHAWPMQKIPRVCEVISGLYCRLTRKGSSIVTVVINGSPCIGIK